MRRNGILPFRQCTNIFRTDRFVSVQTLSGCSLVRAEDEGHVVHMEPEASDEELGRALLEALDQSRFFWPHDDPEFFKREKFDQSLRHWEDEMMRRSGCKTKREAYRDMDWCWAKRSEGAISISPHRREVGKPGYWQGLPPGRTVVMPETRDTAAVGAALRMALDRCE